MKVLFLTIAMVLMFAATGCKERPGANTASSDFVPDNSEVRNTDDTPAEDPGIPGQEKTPMNLVPGG